MRSSRSVGARTVKDALMDLDGPLELPFLSQEVSQDEVDLRRLRVLPGGLGELRYRAIDLAGGEKVETEDVVDGRSAPRIRPGPAPLPNGGPDASERDARRERGEDEEESLVLEVHSRRPAEIGFRPREASLPGEWRRGARDLTPSRDSRDSRKEEELSGIESSRGSFRSSAFSFSSRSSLRASSRMRALSRNWLGSESATARRRPTSKSDHQRRRERKLDGAELPVK